MNSFYKKIGTVIGMLFLSSFLAFSQATSKTIPGSYIIHGNMDSQTMEFFTKSIEAADFEQYRLKDANVELIFKNGFKLELVSAKDLTIKNKIQSVNPNLYQEKSMVPANYTYPVFEIKESGWITAQMNAIEVKVKKP